MSTPIEDTTRIDEAALGLLYLTLHAGNRAWKSLDFAIFDRLPEAGLIDDPIGKAKSIAFAEQGLTTAETAWRKLFTS
jgi:Domain of unknown function (DUF6429)